MYKSFTLKKKITDLSWVAISVANSWEVNYLYQGQTFQQDAVLQLASCDQRIERG